MFCRLVVIKQYKSRLYRLQWLIKNFNHTNTDSCNVIRCNVVRWWRNEHMNFLLNLHHSHSCEHGIVCVLLFVLKIRFCKTPFTRYKRLSNRLNNRLNVCLHNAAVCSTGLTTCCVV